MKALIKTLKRLIKDYIAKPNPPLYNQIDLCKFITDLLLFCGKDAFFSLVYGFEKELGYFSLKELESVWGRWNCRLSMIFIGNRKCFKRLHRRCLRRRQNEK